MIIVARWVVPPSRSGENTSKPLRVTIPTIDENGERATGGAEGQEGAIA
jgi:hypothetical protein